MRDVSNALLLPCVTSPEGFLAQVKLFVNVFGAGEVAGCRIRTLLLSPSWSRTLIPFLS